MFNRSLLFLSALLMSAMTFGVCAEKKIDFCTYSHTRPDIWVGFKSISENNGKIVIVLSDNSHWTIRRENAEQTHENILIKPWEPGDEVRIQSVSIEHDEEEDEDCFILKNVTKDHAYLVDLCPDFANQGVGHLISKIDENGYALTTQEGLVLIFGWFGACTVQDWRRGDQIIINKGDHSQKEDYVVINARNGETAWGSVVYWD